MTNETLLNYAARRGHSVNHVPIEKCRSFTIESESGSYIFVSSGLPRREEKQKTAHELGHCEYGGFYNRYSCFDIRAKAERRANKWAYTKLMPVREIKEACRHGFQEIWQIAEYFDVTCEYASNALDYYRSVGLL